MKHLNLEIERLEERIAPGQRWNGGSCNYSDHSNNTVSKGTKGSNTHQSKKSNGSGGTKSKGTKGSKTDKSNKTGSNRSNGTCSRGTRASHTDGDRGRSSGGSCRGSS